MEVLSEADVVWGRIYFSLASEVTATQIQTLQACTIRQVVCLCSTPRGLRTLPSNCKGLSVNTKKQPVERSQWIFQFPQLYEAISEGLQFNRSVWIIAQSKSIAKLVVAAFLIAHEHNTLSQSLQSLRIVRNAILSESLFFQLQLWSAMGGHLVEDHPRLIKYKESLSAPRQTMETIRRSESYIEAPKRIQDAMGDMAGKKVARLWMILLTLQKRATWTAFHFPHWVKNRTGATAVSFATPRSSTPPTFSATIPTQTWRRSWFVVSSFWCS